MLAKFIAHRFESKQSIFIFLKGLIIEI